MSGFWERLHCTMGRHQHLVVTGVQRVGDKYIATHAACRCGRRRVPIFPGCLHETFEEAYEDHPIEFTELYDAQP